MIDQRNKTVSYKQAFSDYFTGYVNFSGYTSRRGYWMPMGTIIAAFFFLITIMLGSLISTFLSAQTYYSSHAFSRSLGASLLSIAFLSILGLALALPSLAIMTRRLRDVGFSNWGIVILFGLYVLLYSSSIYLLYVIYSIAFAFVLPSLASNTFETDKTDSFSQFFFRRAVTSENSNIREDNKVQEEIVSENITVKEEVNEVAIEESNTLEKVEENNNDIAQDSNNK